MSFKNSPYGKEANNLPLVDDSLLQIYAIMCVMSATPMPYVAFTINRTNHDVSRFRIRELSYCHLSK